MKSNRLASFILAFILQIMFMIIAGLWVLWDWIIRKEEDKDDTT